MYSHISKLCMHHNQARISSLLLKSNVQKFQSHILKSKMLHSTLKWKVSPINCLLSCQNMTQWKKVQIITCPYSGGTSSPNNDSKRFKTVTLYVLSVGIFMVGMSYAGVPLYKLFCQATGLGGQAVAGHDSSKVETMKPVKDRTLRIKFNADTASSMQWNFKPQQSEIKVLPGETALAFYTARNPTDVPIIGISTYNVIPYEAGPYFNKIQCFCFEEQRLNPHEQVDMPVFFYIDPEFAEDPKLQYCDQITLSYTFFEAKKGLTIPLPGYMQNAQ